MRLDRAYIDGFKNLSNFEIDFDESRLTTVVIGQNGAGKSNLIEALVDVFRWVDLNRSPPYYRYEIDYRLDGRKVRLSNRSGKALVIVDGKAISRAEFKERKSDVFPDLVFGYYSGGSRRLERFFDSHQRRYYDAIKLSEDEGACSAALSDRRLFYCRPIHGVFALLSFFAFPNEKITQLLTEKLNILGFHSAMAQFREPWFAKSARGSRNPLELWGAAGPAGVCAREILKVAFLPIALTDHPVDDYRDKNQSEAQLAAFIRDGAALAHLATSYEDDGQLFAALEAVDISDLIRELHLWVTRRGDSSGDVGFSDFSDGERQLLMVLGLTRISRGKRVLFLLDEPDTHLNPAWQNSYLELIRQWTGEGECTANCQFIMTSHNPLTIASLMKEEVRVMSLGPDGNVLALPPYADPRGLGFTATLTEIFGLPTTLDIKTQRAIDERNILAKIEDRSEDQERELIVANDELARLGFLFEDREPLYNDFLKAWHEVRYADRPSLDPHQIEAQRRAMKALIGQLVTTESER
jgi:predicted ATPase